MVAQERAEEQLLLNLCSSDNPLSNFASIKQVSGIKRFYDEAQERCGHFVFFHSNVIAFFISNIKVYIDELTNIKCN